MTDKATLRQTLRKKLKTIPEPTRSYWDQSIIDRLMQQFEAPIGTCIGLYHPLPIEVKCTPLFQFYHLRHHPLALPCVTALHYGLIFREFHPNDMLEEGIDMIGASQPFETKAELQPDWLIIPMLGFDANKTRLGYGGGFYDRTIPTLKPKKTIGLAYEIQFCSEIHARDHDIRLDHIVTEKAVY